VCYPAALLALLLGVVLSVALLVFILFLLVFFDAVACVACEVPHDTCPTLRVQYHIFGHHVCVRGFCQILEINPKRVLISATLEALAYYKNKCCVALCCYTGSIVSM
jgi:hypothetical protein